MACEEILLFPVRSENVGQGSEEQDMNEANCVWAFDLGKGSMGEAVLNSQHHVASKLGEDGSTLNAQLLK